MAIPDGLRPNRIKTIIKSWEFAVETRIWQAVLTRERWKSKIKVVKSHSEKSLDEKSGETDQLTGIILEWSQGFVLQFCFWFSVRVDDVLTVDALGPMADHLAVLQGVAPDKQAQALKTYIMYRDS